MTKIKTTKEMEEGLAFIFDIVFPLGGTAAVEHQALCTAITTRLNVYFKRSKRFAQKRAYQETRTDDSQKGYIVPDVIVREESDKECFLMIEVCRSGNYEEEFGKLEEYLERKELSCKELFVVEYDQKPSVWHRKQFDFDKGEFSEIENTSHSTSIDFELGKCEEWFSAPIIKTEQQ